MQPRTLFTFTAAALAAVIGMYISGQVNRDEISSGSAPSEIQGFVLSTPRKLGVPTLTQGDGTVFDAEDLQGRWSLMFYGFTNCPDICPMTLSTVAAARKASVAFPQVVFVSVDPQRDAAELVGEYVSYFDDSFIGVTGEEKLLEAMARQMSVVAQAQAPAEPGGEYLVDHSSNLMLIDPDVRLVAMLKPPHSIETINRAISVVMAR